MCFVHKSRARLGSPWFVGVAALAITGAESQEARAWPDDGPLAGWSMGGHDIGNSRSNPFEHRLCPASAASLTLKWTATTAGDVSATPAVMIGDTVYFPD